MELPEDLLHTLFSPPPTEAAFPLPHVALPPQNLSSDGGWAPSTHWNLNCTGHLSVASCHECVDISPAACVAGSACSLKGHAATGCKRRLLQGGRQFLTPLLPSLPLPSAVVSLHGVPGATAFSLACWHLDSGAACLPPPFQQGQRHQSLLFMTVNLPHAPISSGAR